MFSRTLGTIAFAAAALVLGACSSDSITAPAPSATASQGSTTGGVQGTAAGRVRVEIVLTANGAFANAKGKAKSQTQNANRELEIEVENVRAGTDVNFFVNGTQVGTTQTTDALQSARVDLSTQLGQTVPVIKAGDVVDVKTAAGASVATGKF